MYVSPIHAKSKNVTNAINSVATKQTTFGKVIVKSHLWPSHKYTPKRVSHGIYQTK